MPKMKTDKGAQKRIKVTGSGKMLRRKQNLNHILEKKSSSRKRRLSGTTEISSTQDKSIRKMLGI
jgi:large subunit ribosomal protein L35